MSDLGTNYLGLELTSPLVCSASPLCENLDNLRLMQDSGAGAIILPSLFEEQISAEGRSASGVDGTEMRPSPMVARYFPDMQQYNRGPEGYLRYLGQAKKAIQIPIIASLNGVTPGSWLHYAVALQEEGADALELNIYEMPVDPIRSGAQVEQNYLDIVGLLKTEVDLPLAIKLSPFFSAPIAFARNLADTGAQGLVLFNRFYQPDFNLETMEIEPGAHLSQPGELLLRLHWVALMAGRVNADLAVSGGVHSAQDVLKAMMAGARVAMMTSVLLRYGIEHLRTIQEDLEVWMQEHGYDSLRQMQGCMSLRAIKDPWGFERASYMRVLRSYTANAQ